MKANDINFLPPAYREQRQRSRNRVRVIVIAALFTAVLSAWWMSQRGDIAELRDYARYVEAELEAAQQQASEAGRLRATYIKLTRQAGVRAELAQPVRHTQVLAVLADEMPAGVGLIELELVAHRPEPAKPGEGDKPAQSAERDKPEPEYLDLELRGLAPDDEAVNDAVARLTDHPLFGGVTLAFSRQAEREGVIGREFALGARIDLEQRYVEAPREGVADAGE